MIALVAEQQHATEFDSRFDRLFTEISRFAQSKGITGCCASGGNCNAEDPEDFAQECLTEYSNRARRAGFRRVQTNLIKRIAHDRLVDAWRKRDRMPNRHELEAATMEATVEVETTVDVTPIGADCDTTAHRDLRNLSDKAVEILRLKHVAQWRDREIADALGMTVDGVQSSLKRSRQRLLTKRVTVVR